MNASNGGSGETAHLRKLARAFFVQKLGYVPKSNTLMLAKLDNSGESGKKDYLYIAV